ncbi:menaquinol-cytochrome c reductase cytochrome b subunit [Paenibacillus phyllosphaerae]|uniref:Menaquinol-cytochrome c reductase cytochrome b subunit n=1 Tax=Paenibacillus phyllosphaerae TaxID=274593 RepID=A0A7W5B2W9_9BACL|nr:hypothetical protein [Paenibacillus phyllosphaerae]MBB3112906.1 menaquinol-cytochrome c reductase cytochrome b subunit [Paenibacillus phyllosphaerae]
MAKRIAIESIVFALVALLLMTVGNILLGMYMTTNYVPDMMNAYESVDYLQHKVSIGGTMQFTLLHKAIAFALLMLVYAGVRLLTAKVLFKDKQH